MAPPPLIQTVILSIHSPMLQCSHSQAVQPTPPSNHSSPNTVRSPGFSMPPTGVSPGSDIQPQRLAHPTQSSRPVQHIQPHIQPRPHQRSLSQNTQNTSNSNRHSFAGFSRQQAQMSPANFYPASFQKHYDQLGKSTPICSSTQLPGSFVRPRLIPFVQTRSTMHKSTCLTISRAKMPTPTHLFLIFAFLPRPITPTWVCRPPLQRRRVWVAMLARTTRLCRSPMIQFWTLIPLDLQPRCTSQTPLVCHRDDRYRPNLYYIAFQLLQSAGVRVAQRIRSPQSSLYMHTCRTNLFSILIELLIVLPLPPGKANTCT